MKTEILRGDCLEIMATMPAESVDAIVTDPPYGLGFMGKKWDALPPGQDWAEECLRVLKPGGHLLAFGGSRTYHRLAVAVEDAGFEIRDQIMWLYGSGFPKSHDVSKAIDKAAGAEREVVGLHTAPATTLGNERTMDGGAAHDLVPLTAPATPEAVKWSGWGTALKPAHEPVVVARKPLIGTVAQNVERFGVGGLNIDGCRAGTGGGTAGAGPGPQGGIYDNKLNGKRGEAVEGLGRWPANLVLDEQAGAMLDAQSGPSKSRKGKPRRGTSGVGWGMSATGAEYEDSGGPSRFFYCAKANKKERNAGLDGIPKKPPAFGAATGDGLGRGISNTRQDIHSANHHPTVKPIAVMRWLVRLVTPPGGTVLDPFVGSGTTGIAAGLEGFEFIGIEREEEYADLAEARIEHWSENE